MPILGFAYGYQGFDREWRAVAGYANHFFFLAWDYAEEVVSGDYLQIEIAGFKVFVSHDTLMRLEGMELVLETVEMDFSMPPGEKCQLLRTRVPES